MRLLFTPQHLKIKTDFPTAHAYTVWLHAVSVKSGSFVEPGFVQHLALCQIAPFYYLQLSVIFPEILHEIVSCNCTVQRLDAGIDYQYVQSAYVIDTRAEKVDYNSKKLPHKHPTRHKASTARVT